MNLRRAWGVIWISASMWFNISLTRAVKDNVDNIPNPFWGNILLWLIVVLAWAWFACNLILAIQGDLQRQEEE